MDIIQLAAAQDRARIRPSAWGTTAALVAALLSACGGGGGDNAATPMGSHAASATSAPTSSSAGTDKHLLAGDAGATRLKALAAEGGTMTQREAVRLAEQSTWGPYEWLIDYLRTKTPAEWLSEQFNSGGSRYTSGADASVHQYTGPSTFCDGRGPDCWRDYYSNQPLLWDFYRNAMTQPDQLRQRVAWALSQIVVVSNVEIESTYGLRNYHNMLLQNAFGNYRELLKQVAMSPVMGEYLGNANNEKSAPNENFARELLQLFSLGPCQLNADATLVGGTCRPVYDNRAVRAYAYALTGWTYPPGGASSNGCWPAGVNCRFHEGDMVVMPSRHDTQAQRLLTDLWLPAGHTAPQALESVLDSLMRHPNMPPFVSRQLIQHLVTSNPSPQYVSRVATAFANGTHAGFGTGVRGDLKAAVAAVLLDPEARTEPTWSGAGRLREPAQVFLGVLRALKGQTDGDSLGWWWGDLLGQHAFRPPSVFNYYPADYPVPGTSLVGPAFGIHGTSTALARINFINHAVNWGAPANPAIPNALGTKVDLSGFTADAADPATLVDRLSMLAFGQVLPTAQRTEILNAVNAFTTKTGGADYLTHRVRTAAYLVFASPQYHIVR